MRIAIATAQVPFISGGAEMMTAGLRRALEAAGHKVEVVMQPFRFGPPSAVRHSMAAWDSEDFDRFDCGAIDSVIALKFPAYYLSHHDKRVWLMHQHRSVYELYDTPYGESSGNPDAADLRDQIIQRDTTALGSATRVFTISRTVSDRLLQFNGVASEPLHQPPANESLFFSGEPMPYIFVPSRLESLKRQDLLIRAMAHVDEPVFALIAGAGGQRQMLKALVAELGLGHRVKFLGRIDDQALRAHYAHSMGVFFGPRQEDYGFVTLEAMLSSRAVITCTDSGGPTHFVRDGETGFIVDPEPQAVAAAINELWADRRRARELGENALTHYRALDISWDHITSALLA